MSTTEDNETNGTDTSEVTELYENKTHLINELLFYVSNYTKGGSCTPENIKNIILSFYDAEEIWKAKALLWKKVKDGILRKFERRNDTRSRTAKDANASDIVQAFQDMDKKSSNDIVFLAADINKIPREHPEKLHELSVLDRLSVLENKFKLVDTSTSRNYAGMIEIVEEVKKTNGKIATNEKLIQDVAQQLLEEVQNKKIDQNKNSKSVSSEISEIERQIPDSGTVPLKVRSSSLPEIGICKKKTSEITQEITQRKSNLQLTDVEPHSRGHGFKQGKLNVQNVGIDVNLGNNKGFSKNIPYTEHMKSYGGYKLNDKRHRSSTYSNINGNQSHGKFQEKPRWRPQALTHGRYQQSLFSDDKRLGSHRNVTYENKKRDEVFFDSRFSEKNRKDSAGFQFTRDQMKRMHYKNKINESNLIRLFISNVPNRFTVDDVYNHFSNIQINVKDLWQSSHPDSRKRSFVVKMPRDEVKYVLEDEVMESHNIRVREYKDRSDY